MIYPFSAYRTHMCTLIFFVYCLKSFVFFSFFISQNYFNHGFIDLQYIEGMLIQILSETKKKL